MKPLDYVMPPPPKTADEARQWLNDALVNCVASMIAEQLDAEDAAAAAAPPSPRRRPRRTA